MEKISKTIPKLALNQQPVNFDKNYYFKNLRKNQENNLLLLGEGNFSFSLALAKLIVKFLQQQQQNQENSNLQFNLYSTSYDSKQELQEKYPEFQTIEQKLQKLSKKSSQFKISLLHRVDATNITKSLILSAEKSIDEIQDEKLNLEKADSQKEVQQQLQQSEEEEKENNQIFNSEFKRMQNFIKQRENQLESLIQQLKLDSKKFDKIIFNHPHTGQDDLTKNSSLVAHFFQSALPLLRNQTSEIQFSLLEDQFERWRLLQIFNYHHFHLVFRDQLSQSIYENGFEARRNLIGSNFQNSNVAKTFQKFSIDSENFIFAQQSQIKEYQELEQLHIYNNKFETQMQEKIQNEEEFNYFCQYCNKGFRKEQGKQTHEREIHVKKGNTSTQDQNLFECQHCNKQFNSEIGQADHVKSKHSENQIEKPEFAGKILDLADVSLLQEDKQANNICRICLQVFESETDLKKHNIWLTPDLKEEQIVECQYCQRQFKEKRALQQHLNHCPNLKQPEQQLNHKQ